MASNISSFSNALPQFNNLAIADACYIYDYYYSSNLSNGIKFDDNTKCRMSEVYEYSQKLIKNNNIVVIPPIARLELQGACQRDIIGAENSSSKQDMFNNPSLICEGNELYSDIESVLTKDPLFYLDEDNITLNIKELFQMSSKENIKSNLDAGYLVYAKENKINNLLTVDKDFLRVQNQDMNIFINSSNFGIYKKWLKNNQSKHQGNLTFNLGSILRQAIKEK